MYVLISTINRGGRYVDEEYMQDNNEALLYCIGEEKTANGEWVEWRVENV